MPRRIRIVLPDIPHHIIQRGNDRQNIFLSQEDYAYYLLRLLEYRDKYQIKISSYCLMTNHIHLLVVPCDKCGISQFMKQLAQRYSQYFNRKYKRTGKLWDNRYKMHLVEPKAEWILSRYIDLNPVKTRMVLRADAYLHSSARGHLGMIDDPLLNRDIIAGRYKDYRAFLLESEEFCEAKDLELEDTMAQEKVFGTNRFRNWVKEKTGYNLKLRGRGRPRKPRSS